MSGGQLQVQATNLPLTNNSGTENVGPLTIPIANPVIQQNSLTFSGSVFIATAGPIGSTVCFIIPPPSNTVQLTLKGTNSADTGIPISASLPFYVPFFNPNVSNTIGLLSASSLPLGTVVVLLWM